MLSMHADQAEGLRRIAADNMLRVVTVASATAGAGKTALAINLAAAIARSGREVLLLDGDTTKNTVSRRLAVMPAHDLLDVIHGSYPAGKATAIDGVSVLPVGRGAEAMTSLSRRDPEWLVRRFYRTEDASDVMIVDTPSRAPGCVWAAGSAAHDVLVLLRQSSASLLANYALIKAMIRQLAIRRFSILVTGVPSDLEARVAFEKIARAAQRYLAVSLRYTGYVPNDDDVARADALGTCAVDAFPAAPAAVAFREVARRLMGGSAVRLASADAEPFREVMKSDD